MSDSAPGFIHLHVHSSYSLSEGAIKAEKLASLAKDAKMPAVALTDTANLFGALEFAQSCSGKGIQPIMGCQLWLSRTASDPRPEAERQPPDPIVVLAMDAQGLDNLQRLSSRSFLGADASGRPCITLPILEDHAAGLFLLTGGTCGPVNRLLSEGRRHDPPGWAG
ncbi:MAG: PHP domain-containing protein [Acetobacteraceae bacterium]|nr:MAG: PHP domain-containing protein [Acetobacteraceae bacterium]